MGLSLFADIILESWGYEGLHPITFLLSDTQAFYKRWDNIWQEKSGTWGEAPPVCWNTIPFRRSSNEGRVMILSSFRLGGTVQGNRKITQVAYFQTGSNPRKIAT